MSDLPEVDRRCQDLILCGGTKGNKKNVKIYTYLNIHCLLSGKYFRARLIVIFIILHLFKVETIWVESIGHKMALTSLRIHLRIVSKVLPVLLWTIV